MRQIPGQGHGAHAPAGRARRVPHLGHSGAPGHFAQHNLMEIRLVNRSRWVLIDCVRGRGRLCVSVCGGVTELRGVGCSVLVFEFCVC